MPETMGSGVAAFDADGDGRVDLLFVNGRWWPGDPKAAQQPTLSFWKNVTEPGGPIRFEDRTKEAGLAISLYGMGVAVGDVNDDGAPGPRDHRARRHPPPRERRQGSLPGRHEGLGPRGLGLGHVGRVRGLRRRRRPRPLRRPVRELDAEDGHVLLARREDEVLLHAGALQRRVVPPLQGPRRREVPRDHEGGRPREPARQGARRRRARRRRRRTARPRRRERHLAEQPLPERGDRERNPEVQGHGDRGRRRRRRGRARARRHGRRVRRHEERRRRDARRRQLLERDVVRVERRPEGRLLRGRVRPERHRPHVAPARSRSASRSRTSTSTASSTSWA